MTFNQIYNAALDLYGSRHPLTGRVNDIVGNALENANDTVQVEHEAAEEEWERIASGSLCVLLGDEQDPAVCAWFKRLGFSW